MEWLAVLVMATAVAVLLLRLRRLRRLLHDCIDALEHRRPFLLESDIHLARRYGLVRLQQTLEELRSQYLRASRQEQKQLRQIEMTLGNLREAVLLVDSRNTIVLANSAANQLLHGAGSLQGRQLERVVQSAGFLEYTDQLRTGRATELREITLSGNGEPRVFEVAGGIVSGEGTGDEELVLYVLHDISRLKRLEGVRKEFVANVSHELRTPVTIMKGFADALSDDYERLKDEERRGFLTKIQRNANRLHALLEDLLALSRLEASGEALSLTRESLEALIREVTDDYEERLQNLGVSLRLDLDPSIPTVSMDPIKIAQVLQNLVDNAVRYARGMTQLTIRSRNNGEWVDISVEDDGCGIPAGDVDHIFERFYRVDKGRSRELGGTGLGLSIVKHIVQLHRGNVRASSSADKGTTITFSLPLQSGE